MQNQFQPSSFSQPVQSQYRGSQKQFQPTGPVQSFYKGIQPGSIASGTQAQGALSSYRPTLTASVPTSQFSSGYQSQASSTFAANRSQALNAQYNTRQTPTQQYRNF